MDPSTAAAQAVRLERGHPDLPRYRLVSRLATGGMAEVFLALMPGSCGTKPVVIKRLWPELARDPEHLRLFRDEVRLTLCLHHPNVIHGYESGHDGEYPYLAMEYLDGQSFKHILDRLQGDGGLSLPLSLKIICDVLAGLEYVHGLVDLSGKPLHVIHRDVSPQNVFVTCDGAVKLIDFGIARSSLSQTAAQPRDTRGRVAYMAPEQLLDERVDHRADLFSVGVMLWEAAVGQRLWQGLSDGEIMQRLLSQEPLPRLPRGRGFPPGLATICARALALHPDQRYASASDFQSDLAAVSTGSMPAQTRLLGNMVTRVFASSRALSRTMIQQSLPVDADAEPGTTADASAPSRSTRAGTALTKRSTGSLLATMHDDVTQVGPAPLPSRPARRRSWLALAPLVFLLSGGGEWLYLRMHRSSERPMAAALASVEHRAEPAVAAPEPPPVAPPADDPPTPAAVPARVANHGAPSPRWTATTKRKINPNHRATVTVGEPVPPSHHDIFDTALDRAAHQVPARAIDRQDPYSP